MRGRWRRGFFERTSAARLRRAFAAPCAIETRNGPQRPAVGWDSFVSESRWSTFITPSFYDILAKTGNAGGLSGHSGPKILCNVGQATKGEGRNVSLKPSPLFRVWVAVALRATMARRSASQNIVARSATATLRHKLQPREKQ